jgi:hypothetical protein
MSAVAVAVAVAAVAVAVAVAAVWDRPGRSGTVPDGPGRKILGLYATWALVPEPDVVLRLER